MLGPAFSEGRGHPLVDELADMGLKSLEPVIRRIVAFEPDYLMVWPMVVVKDSRRRGKLDASDRSGSIEGAGREVGQGGIEAESYVKLRAGQGIGENLRGPVDGSAPVAEVRPQPLGRLDIKNGHRMQDMADLLQFDNACKRPDLVVDVQPGGIHCLEGNADVVHVIVIMRNGFPAYP